MLPVTCHFSPARHPFFPVPSDVARRASLVILGSRTSAMFRLRRADCYHHDFVSSHSLNPSDDFLRGSDEVVQGIGDASCTVVDVDDYGVGVEASCLRFSCGAGNQADSCCCPEPC